MQNNSLIKLAKSLRSLATLVSSKPTQSTPQIIKTAQLDSDHVLNFIKFFAVK